MKPRLNKKLDKLIVGLPENLSLFVSQWVERLESFHPGSLGKANWPTESFKDLTKVVACSEFAADAIVREWPWVLAQRESGGFDHAPSRQLLDAFAAEITVSGDDDSAVKMRLRQFRNRWLLHVIWREVNAAASLDETLFALSDLADRLLGACSEYAKRRLANRYGRPRGKNGEEIPLVILAMGKLGGRELNFSSDIDLIFLYTSGGQTDGTRRISAHEYFTRLTGRVISLFDDVTSDGFVFRVDTRLRPFGESGPPVVSFPALESYLPQHGRSWERYAYIKARITGAPVSKAVSDELMSGMIEPFVYRRYIDFGVLEGLREMKALIAAEVRKKELASNIKLGPGGIREIEFIAQSLQLVRGGSDVRLRGRELQRVLPRLANHRGLSAEAVGELARAYIFLRRLENFIQGLRDQQTHDLPHNPTDRQRLCLAMNYADWSSLTADLETHRERVSQRFDDLAFAGDQTRHAPATAAMADHWMADSTVDEWRNLLEKQGFAEAAELAEVIVKFHDAPLLRQIDKIARRRLDHFMPALLFQLRAKAHPATVYDRITFILDRILRRSAYVALLNENPPVRERLVDLCESSAYLTEQISRHPLLLDELLDPRVFSTAPAPAELAADLEQRMAGLGMEDSESRVEGLTQFQRASLFRVAVADFSGVLPIMQVSDRLTDLAELVIKKALSIAYVDLADKHGEPLYRAGARQRVAGFGVIAYGKLGGIELSYGSDLDLVFLHESGPQGDAQQMTDGDKPLENSVFFGRLVRRLVHFLTTQTGSGALYEVDTRLRPSGRSGLLVTSLDAFERYQDENAWTWEHQALLRSRAVAGSAVVAREFERIRAETLRHRVRLGSLLTDVTSMRAKMREQLNSGEAGRFDLKQGEGGIADIEFIVQYLVLKNARSHPAVIHYPDNIRQLGTLAAAGCLPEEDVLKLQDVYKAYRFRLHRLVLDSRSALVPEAEFAGERAFVTRVWHAVMR